MFAEKRASRPDVGPGTARVEQNFSQNGYGYRAGVCFLLRCGRASEGGTGVGWGLLRAPPARNPWHTIADYNCGEGTVVGDVTPS